MLSPPGTEATGTYDWGDDQDYNVLRIKAARLAYLKYLILLRDEQGVCQCDRCFADRHRPWETEP